MTTTNTFLIATLGDSPIVVTATALKLQAADIGLAGVRVVFPEREKQIAVQYGFVQETLQDRHNIPVDAIHLPFEDANSHEHGMTFLQKISAQLEKHQAAGDHVILSLAGGRKNTSALLAVMAQFYPCVTRLLHLHAQPGPQHPYDFETLLGASPAERQRWLSPPLEDFELVDIRVPPLAKAAQLRAWLKAPDSASVEIEDWLSPEAEAFYSAVLTGLSAAPLKLSLSATAFTQVSDWITSGSNRVPVLESYLALLRDAQRLKAHRHGSFSRPTLPGKTFHFCKHGRTAERPFFYTQPNPLDAYPGKPVNETVLVGISLENDSHTPAYDKSGDDWLDTGDLDPARPYEDLPRRKVMLIAPLGEYPMVVTQIIAGLEAAGNFPKGSEVALVYPRLHGNISAGAEILERVLSRRSTGPIVVRHYPIDIADTSTQTECDTYWQELTKTIGHIQTDHADKQIVLSIAGGRKAMSALGLVAAQQMGITRVYHTLPHDAVWQHKMEAKCSIDKLIPQPRLQQENLLFPPDLAQHATLFSIPVVSVRQPDV